MEIPKHVDEDGYAIAYPEEIKALIEREVEFEIQEGLRRQRQKEERQKKRKITRKRAFIEGVLYKMMLIVMCVITCGLYHAAYYDTTALMPAIIMSVFFIGFFCADGVIPIVPIIFDAVHIRRKNLK